MELLTLLPPWYQYMFVGVLGLIIGSFLNVYIYRFHTGRSLSGSSHCLSCGKSLRWYELVPVLSYLVLRGRCQGCQSYIPLRYALVESLTAVLFLLSFLYGGISTVLPVVFALVSLLVIVTVYDLYHLIIPDELVVALSVTVLCLWALQLQAPYTVVQVVPHLLAASATFAFFGGLWKFSHGRWIGFGDAKLATPLAFLLGPLPAFSFIVLSFWVGAIISVSVLASHYLIKRGKNRLSRSPLPITIKSEVPFAPFIIIAFLLVFFFDVNVLQILSFVSF